MSDEEAERIPYALQELEPSDRISHAMNDRDRDGAVTGYMCMIDWECEIGAAYDGNRVFPSVEALQKHHDCWHECGIVEVKVSFVKVIHEEQDPRTLISDRAAGIEVKEIGNG